MRAEQVVCCAFVTTNRAGDVAYLGDWVLETGLTRWALGTERAVRVASATETHLASCASWGAGRRWRLALSVLACITTLALDSAGTAMIVFIQIGAGIIFTACWHVAGTASGTRGTDLACIWFSLGVGCLGSLGTALVAETLTALGSGGARGDQRVGAPRMVEGFAKVLTVVRLATPSTVARLATPPTVACGDEREGGKSDETIRLIYHGCVCINKEK